jgi:two-component system phosphate regulon response regulator PhoB
MTDQQAVAHVPSSAVRVFDGVSGDKANSRLGDDRITEDPAKASSGTTGQSSSQGPARVLIVEDDRDLNNLLRFTLESSGQCQADSLFESSEVLAKLRQDRPSLLILDVMLPGPTDGLGLLKLIRNSHDLAALPVILLTAKSQEHDRIAGFESGADDYISKPFSPKELMLRVHALLRRSQGSALPPAVPTSQALAGAPMPQPTSVLAANSSEPVVEVGPIRIYPELFKVTLDGETLPLTSTEYQLLCFLAERVGRLQNRTALLQKVWGYEGNVNTRTVDTHVKRLRQKLGAHGSMIETVHGFGYQLVLGPTTDR